MPYFVRVGAIPPNVHGIGARGYHIFRRSRTVTVRWGGITVTSAKRFHWVYVQSVYVQSKRFAFKTDGEASNWLASEIVRRCDRERYSRLPVGQKILTKPSPR